MKKIVYSFFIVVIFFATTYAQTSARYDWLAQNSWAFGFGGIFDRYISTNTTVTGAGNFGGYLSIQRNFSEHVGVRLNGSYFQLDGKVGTAKVTNNTLAGNFDLLYYLAPVEPVSPYFGVGVGGVSYTIKNSPTANLNKSNTDYKLNISFGAEWNLGKNWKLNTELGYSTLPSSKFDGVYGTNSGGLLGGNTDTYMNMNLGLMYYFAKGVRSNLNDEYEGVSAVDYAKIEDIVKKYQTQPTEVDYNRIEDIVKRNTPTIVGGGAPAPSNWVLIGVNFDFDKTTLRSESIPILYNAAEILLNHPEIKVEIQGYSDNVGSEKANQKLSLARAETVKNFLVSKGVSSDRLTTIGLGSANPIMSNKTAEGRALNRRIEFKILNK